MNKLVSEDSLKYPSFSVLAYILRSQLRALMLSINIQMLHPSMCLDAQLNLVLADEDKIGCDSNTD